jgi:DUF4097 and DUF4098 domain-containing protein YvlB
MPDSSRLHVPLRITTRSGSVRVIAEESGDLVVDGGTIEQNDDGSLHIRRAPSAGTIEVHCATGTDVTVGTASGKVELVGTLGAVRVATVSGSIRVGDVGRIDVRTKSGKVVIGDCAGECRVTTKSSSVHVRRAALATVAAVSGIVVLERVGGAEVKTISGKVLMSLVADAARVSVHTVSGKVEIQVPPDLRPAARLRTVSGNVRCDCPIGDGPEISVGSVSGSIRVSSA